MGPAVGIQKTMIGDQLKSTIRNALLQKILGGQGGQGGGQGGQAPPMPATPLPGS
jgi:hypothetical protein